MASSSSSSSLTIRSWRTAFLTLRDETSTGSPAAADTSIGQLMQNLIFSNPHSLISSTPDLPPHEVTSDLLFLMELVANSPKDGEDIIYTFTQTCHLVDIVDFNGSFLARVCDIAGANPIILVVTKVDLLPKGTHLNCVGDWVVEATSKKKLNVLSVHLTSSKSLVGIAGVASEIQKEKKGSANVGKSAFINALLILTLG